MARNEDRRSIRCSFCGKPQSLVERMIAGNNCYICDECVRMCASIVGEGEEGTQLTGYDGLPLEFSKLPKPMQIKARLDDYVIGQDRAKRCCPWRYTTTTNVYSIRRRTMWSCKRATSCS